MFNKKLLNQLMKAAYGLGVVFLLAGMLLSAVAMPARAQEETPPAPTEEAPTEEVVLTEEVTPTEEAPTEVVLTEPVVLTIEGPSKEPTEEPLGEAQAFWCNTCGSYSSCTKIDKSGNQSYTAPNGRIITSVVVKAGTDCIPLTGSNTCYTLTGIGTNSITISKNSVSGCKDISHLLIYSRPPAWTPTNMDINGSCDATTSTVKVSITGSFTASGDTGSYSWKLQRSDNGGNWDNISGTSGSATLANGAVQNLTYNASYNANRAYRWAVKGSGDWVYSNPFKPDAQSCIYVPPTPSMDVVGSCETDPQDPDRIYKYTVTYANMPNQSYLYQGDTPIANITGSGTYSFYSTLDSVTLTAKDCDYNPSLGSPTDMGGAQCHCTPLITKTATATCSTAGLVFANGTCNWNATETAGLYRFDYTVNYTNMPGNGLLTLEYGSPYPTQAVSGSGSYTFTVYSTTDPGVLTIRATGTSVTNLFVTTTMGACPTASLTVDVDDCVVSGEAYTYNYVITPVGVPNGATINYDGGSVFPYAGGNVTVNGSSLTTLNAEAVYKGVTIASGSATVTPEDTRMCGPSITVDGTCRDDLAGNPVEYTFTATGHNLFGGIIVTDPGGLFFPVTQTGNTIKAVWTLDAAIYDEFTEDDAAALTCTTPVLNIARRECYQILGGEDVEYTFAVHYEGYKAGDEFFLSTDLVNPIHTATGTSGDFTFASLDDTVTVVSALGDVISHTDGETGQCPVPTIRIYGRCEANDALTGYEYFYDVEYDDLVKDSTINYDSTGTPILPSFVVPANGSGVADTLGPLTYTTVTATWNWAPLAPAAMVLEPLFPPYNNSATATATVDMETCPVLNLTVENTACDISGDGGHVLNIWTVTNPGVHPVYFEWMAAGSGESGNGTVPANGTTTFTTQSPETTSVTITWDSVSGAFPIMAESSVYTSATPDMNCGDVMDLAILDPFCSLETPEDESSWQMTWTVQNPNTWAVKIYYSVNGGVEQGPLTVPANSTMGLVNTPLGSHTVKITWDGGFESTTVTDGLWINICENWPYNPPDYPDYPIIPVTGGELQAPAAGGELLIPVTGADMSAPLVSTNFFTNLYTYFGLFFLGIGLVLQGVKARITK